MKESLTSAFAHSEISKANASEAATERASTPTQSFDQAKADVRQDQPWIADEHDRLTADDPESLTRRIAAIEVARADERPFLLSRVTSPDGYGLARRSRRIGSATERVAQDMVDAAEVYESWQARRKGKR